MRTSKVLPTTCSLKSFSTLPLSIRQSIPRQQCSFSQSYFSNFSTTGRIPRRQRTPALHFQRRGVSSQTEPSQIVRPLVPPPTEGSGPLLSRRADRELPSIAKGYVWLKTLPIFIFLVTASSLAIFNYQKSSSSTVNSILYALRTNETAREILGDEVYFASKVPWIRGEMNQLHGIIDIRFWVKGTRSKAETRFVSLRRKKGGYFETLEWSLKTEDGEVVQLLDEGDGKQKGVVPWVAAEE